MFDIKERVRQLQSQGLNCAQVVLQLDLDLKKEESSQLLRAFRPMGGGLGAGKTCGCIIGGAAALASRPADGLDGHRQCKAMAKQLMASFEEAFGSTECAWLRRKEAGFTPTPCPVLMERTFEMCLDILQENGYAPD